MRAKITKRLVDSIPLPGTGEIKVWGTELQWAKGVDVGFSAKTVECFAKGKRVTSSPPQLPPWRAHHAA
jgi:hypothetical protein